MFNSVWPIKRIFDNRTSRICGWLELFLEFAHAPAVIPARTKLKVELFLGPKMFSVSQIGCASLAVFREPGEDLLLNLAIDRFHHRNYRLGTAHFAVWDQICFLEITFVYFFQSISCEKPGYPAESKVQWWLSGPSPSTWLPSSHFLPFGVRAGFQDWFLLSLAQPEPPF